MSIASLAALHRLKEAGEPIASLTAYDASFAAQLAAAGIDMILVGDSLGMVVQGRETTVPVTMDDMVYHTAATRRGSGTVPVVADLPFLAYRDPEYALDCAGRLMQEGGAHAVKVEGAGEAVKVVQRLTSQGIPVCAHLGLQPQSVFKLGGYRVQGREPIAAKAMLNDAHALEVAGADCLVLEAVPRELAGRIRAELRIPVIGIGAGADCDGQVLVLYDMLGITPSAPRFSHDFLAEHNGIAEALRAYVAGVKDGSFPAPENGFD
ncbi:MAG: 3-methyl-2-oxobutanoate hydroxymethyltransferase [Pseudomonadota bacterium]